MTIDATKRLYPTNTRMYTRNGRLGVKTTRLTMVRYYLMLHRTTELGIVGIKMQYTYLSSFRFVAIRSRFFQDYKAALCILGVATKEKSQPDKDMKYIQNYVFLFPFLSQCPIPLWTYRLHCGQ